MRSQDGMTIAIPNWNHEILLPRAISSALRGVDTLQKHGIEAEVLVVDDYSRDGSPTLLRQLEARHFRDGLRVLAFASNGGLAANRNQALLHARYRHITFLDADNELVPDNLPYFSKTLNETNATAAYGNLLMRLVASRCAFHVTSNESVQAKIFDSNYIDALAVYDRLHILDVGGFDSSCPSWEDAVLWLHLVTNGRRVVFVPLVLGYYYILPESMLKQESAVDTRQKLHTRLKRMFNQVEMRHRLPANAHGLRYHPDIGYL